MVTLVTVRCTGCGTLFTRHNYHWKGRHKKAENRPRVDGKCYICRAAVTRV